MANHYSSRSSCRLCAGNDLKLELPLGESPVSEKYVSKDQITEESLAAPLDVYFCINCKHVQLIDVIEPGFLWSDFTFETGRDPRLIQHFEKYASKVIEISKIAPDDLIVDVGSNDGTLLKSFKDRGFSRVLGIDPASEIVQAANDAGIPTVLGFMDAESGQRIRAEHGSARVITANNVYAHVDSLTAMTGAIRDLLAEDGLFVFEASYLLDVVQKNLIGTIFHEHLSYHSLTSLVPFLKNLGLELFHVERGPEQGGSIVGYVQREGGPYSQRASVNDLLVEEMQARLDEPATLEAMFERLEGLKSNVNQFVADIRSEGKIISGFGAARAGTTLLSYFGVGQELSRLYDDNEKKHFRFSPGDRLEVVPTCEIYEDKPDALLILAWIHADKILASHKEFIEEGGTFVRLFPEFQIISA